MKTKEGKLKRDVIASTLVITPLQRPYISLGLIIGTDKPRCWGRHILTLEPFQIWTPSDFSR